MTGTIRCPDCGVTSSHPVPDDACQYFLECPACGQVMRPLPGDCCVFCSHGDQRCPSRSDAGRSG